MSDWNNRAHYVDMSKVMAAEDRRQTARATLSAAEALSEMRKEQAAAEARTEAREQKMLFWTRVAGIGAILALVVAIIGVAVTLAVS